MKQSDGLVLAEDGGRLCEIRDTVRKVTHCQGD